ncbi:MAG: hypothetical protein HUU55_02540 [Myxococcales bacterium]|nr:hypothetical protein [Myxococcales bacterium]
MTTSQSNDVSAPPSTAEICGWWVPYWARLSEPQFFKEIFGATPFVFRESQYVDSSRVCCGFSDPLDVLNRLGGPVNVISPRDGSRPIEKTVQTIEEATAAYDSGWAAAVPDIDRRIPDVHTARCLLAEILEIPWATIRTGLFLAPPGGGLAYHFDARHIFSIQWLGEKRWVYEPNTQAPYPLENHVRPHVLPDQLSRYVTAPFPDRPTSEAMSVILRPGSALYLPLGYWHETEALTPSVSVSFGVDVPRVLDRWLERLRECLLTEPRFRNSQPLPKTMALCPEETQAAQIDELNLLFELVAAWKKGGLPP